MQNCRYSLCKAVRHIQWANLVCQQQQVGHAEAACSELSSKVAVGWHPSSRDWNLQIEKDLHRTFPGHPVMDGTGRSALRRILAAYARRNPTVGYCQVLSCHPASCVCQANAIIAYCFGHTSMQLFISQAQGVYALYDDFWEVYVNQDQVDNANPRRGKHQTSRDCVGLGTAPTW